MAKLTKREEEALTAIIAGHVFDMGSQLRARGLGLLAIDMGRDTDPLRPEVIAFARKLLLRLWDEVIEGKERTE